jgi:nucleoside-diphosphate-sugar epimerase
MNILLTGSDGFIGSHLFHQLKEEHDVIGFDIKNGHDILNSELPKDIDLVIHLAGLSGVKDSLNRPTDYWKTNVIGTQRLFEHYENTRIIYASSSTAHEPWKNPYAMSKYSMEQLFHTNSLGLRFTTAYGPGARKDMLIPQILKGRVNYINVNHSRDFIHVNDLISAIETVMKIDLRGVIDIGTGESNKLVDIVDYFKIDYDKKMGDETERLDNKADISIMEEYNWSAKIDLYKYIKENKNVN